MDFQTQLLKCLEQNCINRTRRIKYQSVKQRQTIEKIKFINSTLGISLGTISTFLNNSPAACSHWLKSRNNIPSNKMAEIDSLFKFSLSTLQHMINNNDSLSKQDIDNINFIVDTGNELLKPPPPIAANVIFAGGHWYELRERTTKEGII